MGCLLLFMWSMCVCARACAALATPIILGLSRVKTESDKFWHDNKGANVNAIRTRNAIAAADIVVVRFGDKYKQWNAAFDAGYAAALGKSLIVMHGPDHQHALKEVDAAALAVTETPEQVVHILRYVLEGTLP